MTSSGPLPASKGFVRWDRCPPRCTSREYPPQTIFLYSKSMRLCTLGCRWGYIKLRRPSRFVRVLGEFPQAPGDLYDDPAYSDNDRYCHQDNGRIALGARPRDKSNQAGAVQ